MLFGFEAVQNNYGIKWLLLLPQHCLSPSVLKGSISFKCAGRYKDGWMDRNLCFTHWDGGCFLGCWDKSL